MRPDARKRKVLLNSLTLLALLLSLGPIPLLMAGTVKPCTAVAAAEGSQTMQIPGTDLRSGQHTAAAVALNWSTCHQCPEAPEVRISDNTINMGIAYRPEDANQNSSIHGASALLPAAAEYTVSFDFTLFTWDSYNPIEAGWTGYWDSFSVSVANQPYWELALNDPVTPDKLPGLGFIWGGIQWADGNLEQLSGSKTVTMQGHPSGDNYLNVVLDTATGPQANHLYPSWGTVTITEVRTNASDTLPSQASDLARSVVGAEYLWGGKGWDFSTSSFAEVQQIREGSYTYWNPRKTWDPYEEIYMGGKDIGKGLDCSGLILWSYNKAFGATSMLDTPIRYEGADGQYRYNTVPVDESELNPGDLLFFDWDNNGWMDHVAMYMGDGAVVHASEPGVGIISVAKDGLSGFETRRVKHAQVGLVLQTGSPVSLVVTDPDGVTISADMLVETGQEGIVKVPGVFYYSVDNDGDDVVIAPDLKPGNYTVKVVPKPGASPSDTYSLTAEGAAKVVSLAQNVRIEDIPPLGYRIISDGKEIVPGRTYKAYLPLVLANH